MDTIYDASTIPQDTGFRGVEHPVKPERYSVNGPKQTNRWWQNLVLGRGSAMVALYPYLVKMTDSGFQLSHPTLLPTETYITSPFVPNWELQLGSHFNWTVTAEDDLSCTVKLGEMATLPLVRGSPYLTVELTKAPLKLKTIHAILEKNKISDHETTVTFNNGQTWVFFTSSPSDWNHSSTDMSLETEYSGSLRVAQVNQPINQNLPILEKYSPTYPVSGQVKYDFPGVPEDGTATIHFQFETKGGGELLMFTLPHHQDILINPQRQDLLGYKCIKGKLDAVVGNAWSMSETLTEITWDSPNDLLPGVSRQIRSAIRNEPKVDLEARGSYTFGKLVAKLARIAQIAHQVKDHKSRDHYLARIKSGLEPWLSGKNKNSLVYDQTWGGLVTSDSLKDNDADYGNAMYNDHHFHYGYFLYAAAVVGNHDPDWLKAWENPLLLIIKDFANPSKDSDFPKFRQKDFYDGHSWASGLYAFQDNRNQESTSESVNGYYAMYLLGVALGNSQLANLANLLLMTEIRSSKKYWHMHSKNTVYPQLFSKHKTVGILWGDKVDYATWFGTQPEYIHGIQLLPFTPISHLLLERDWIQEAYPVMETALARTTPPIQGGWRTYLHMAHAIIDPNAAYQEFMQTPMDMDDGNSLTNILYWFFTQPNY